MNLLMKTNNLKHLIAALFSLLLPLMAHAQTSLTLPKGRMDVEQWVARHFARRGEVPFSFTYGGQPSSAFLKTWGYTVRRHVMPQTGATNVIYTYTAPDGSLQVSCDVKIYRPQKAVMWVLRFKNTGTGKSETIANVRTTDLLFHNNSISPFTLHSTRFCAIPARFGRY